MEDYSVSSWKRVQIPAFGNWDYCDEVPITQYFDSAMLQAAGHYCFAAATADADHDDLFKVPSTTPPHKTPHHHTKARKVGGGRKAGGGEKRMARELQMRKQHGKVYDLTNKQSPNMITSTTTTTATTTSTTKPRAPKAVDEDLYKIPPELLYQIKPKKKRLLRNLWSGCLGLNCIA